MQIQELWLNPETFCKSEKNILSRVTCDSRLPQSAVCRIQNGGILRLVFDRPQVPQATLETVYIAGFHTSGAWVQLVYYEINNTRPIYSERARRALQNP